MLAGGCSDPGQSADSGPEVTLTPVGSALHAPVWSYREHTLVAPTDDHRIAEISSPADPAATRTRLSTPLDAARNVQISERNDQRVFVPQSQRGTVAVVDLTSLQSVDEFHAGPAPSYVSEDAGQRVLLVLSADGSSVTPVNEYGFHQLPRASVAGEPATWIDGATRGRAIDYHLYGSSGIRYYKGPSSPAEERGSISLDVAAAASDRAKVTRTYVAPREEPVLYAIDSRRDGEGMTVVGSAELPSPIQYIGTDDTRIYAATSREIVVLETLSFAGYPHGTIPIIRTVDYRSVLPAGSAGSAPLSGMAIGPDRVYVTLAGQKYLVSVAKPRM